MWIVLCIFGLALGQAVDGSSIADQMAETTQVCCTQGTDFAKNHGSEDCSASAPPDVPAAFASLCIVAMDQCCKDYIQKKRECEAGTDIAISTNSCDSAAEPNQDCCQQCVRGKSVGSSKGVDECRADRTLDTVEGVLGGEAFMQCCKKGASESSAGKAEGEKTGDSSSHQGGSPVAKTGDSSSHQGGSPVAKTGDSSSHQGGSPVAKTGDSSSHQGGSPVAKTGDSSSHQGGSPVAKTGDSSSHQGGSPVAPGRPQTDDSVASICEEYAPNELCAHHCIPVPGSYKCECNPGYRLMSDGRNCMEVVKNRCKPKNPCQHKCNDNGVQVKCSCRRGYQLMADGKSCEDIDECRADPPVCLPSTECHNVQGSYKCMPKKSRGPKEAGECPAGFTRNTRNNACDDVNECALPSPPCPAYLCENTVGGYKCGGVSGDPANLPDRSKGRDPDDRCPPGFRMSYDEECEDVDECAHHKDDCNPLSQFCINTRGSFYCQNKVSRHCPPGFKSDPLTNKCEDINECEDSQDICRADQVCINLPGQYDCKLKSEYRKTHEDQCPEGMRKHRETNTCEDIDECLEGTHLCDNHQKCLNTNGSHECRCRLGYELDPITGGCVDVNECAADTHNCVPGSQRCDNTIGSFICVRFTSCGTGYILQATSGTCEDIDECALGTHNCAFAGPGWRCENRPGSFRCVSSRPSTTTTAAPEYEYEYYDSDEVEDNATKPTRNEPEKKPASPFTTTTSAPSNSGPNIIQGRLPPPEVDPLSTLTANRPPEIPPDSVPTESKPEEKPHQPVEPQYTPESQPDVRQPELKQPDQQTEMQQPNYQRPDQEPDYNQPEQRQPEQQPDYNQPEQRQPEYQHPEQQPDYNQPEQRQPEYQHPEQQPDYNQPEQRQPEYQHPEQQPDYNQPEQRQPEYQHQENKQPEYQQPESQPQEPSQTEPSRQQENQNTNESQTEQNRPNYYETDVPSPTPPRVVLVDVGKETATVTAEKKEDGSVFVDTRKVPKNEWTKINLKPSDCQLGFESDEYGACVDIDECAKNLHSCSGLTETCRNTVGGHLCDCAAGFRRDLGSGDCHIITTSSSTTSTTTSTERLFWGYPEYKPPPTRPFRPRTMCDFGYHYNSETRQCEDIDECTNGQANCAAVELCVNTLGGYRCECPPHWRLDERRQRCVPERAGPGMPPGYHNQVQPPPPSQHELQATFKGHKVVDPEVVTVGDSSAVITCPNGYQLGFDNTCEDIDECSTGDARCGEMLCTNLAGGYVCSCPQGHTLVDGRRCQDVDECALQGNMPICSQNADCVNTAGSFQCKCHDGFRSAPVNDKVCVDVDECVESGAHSLCQHRCNNVWGGYRCSCHRGYRLNPDNSTCSDIDECTVHKSKVPCVGRCVNEPGSYRCTCPPGYRLSEDKRSCIDIDECETGEAPCSKSTGSNDVCLNTRGGYRCQKIICPPGYKLENKHRCTRIEKVCPLADWDCAHQPTTYSYNYITFVSKLYIPDSKVDLFTMRGPSWPGASMRFQLRLNNVDAPPTVKERADINSFLLVHTGHQAVMSLVRSLEGPQSIELELSMELYNGEQFGGIAVAKLFIYVSEYEF